MSSDAWDEFSKTILERCLIICLWNPLLGSLCVRIFAFPVGGLFSPSTCLSTCSRSLFFTAAHFQLALVAASICHFVTAATKFSCCSVPTKNVSFVFFVCLSVFFFLFLALDLFRPFSRRVSLACRLLSLFLRLSLALYSKFVDITINLSLIL